MPLPFVTYAVELTFTEPALGTVPMNPDVYRDYIESKKPEEQRDEESQTVESREERGWTGYHRVPDEYEAAVDPKALLAPGSAGVTLDVKLARKTGKLEPVVARRGHLFAYDYTIRGYLKESLNALRQLDAHDLRGVKTKVDQFVFVEPRRVPFAEATPHRGGPVDQGGCGHGGITMTTTFCSLVHAAHDVLERPLRAETPQGPRVALARSDVLKVGTRLGFHLKVLAPKLFPEDLLRLAFERGELVGWGQWRSGSWGRFVYTLAPVAPAAGTSKPAKIITAEPRPERPKRTATAKG